jgi:hypothetical protein
VALKANLIHLSQSVMPGQPLISMILGRKEESNYLQFTHRGSDSLKQLEHRVPILILSPTIIAQYGEPEWDAPTMTTKFPSLNSVLN